MSYTHLPSPLVLFEQEILPKYPEPNDPYERGLWCTELGYVFKELSLEFDARYRDAISMIFSENLCSDLYTIETPLTFIRTANTAKLREKLPEVFASIAYIKATDAEKILGRKMIHMLCKEKAPERIADLEQVNLGDMEKVLTVGELREFVKVMTKPGVPKIQRRDDL